MHIILATIAALAMAAPNSWSSEIPAPPEGYRWNEVSEMKGAFLVPEGWHVRREEAKGTIAYFVTEQPVEPPEKYLVGVSINIFLSNPGAPWQVHAVLAEEAKQHSVELERGEFGPFKTLQCRFELSGTSEHKAIQVVHLAVTNPKTHATYLVMFESPTEEWQRTWAIGEKILKMLALNATV